MNRQQRPRDRQSHGPVTQQKDRIRLQGEDGLGKGAQGECSHLRESMDNQGSWTGFSLYEMSISHGASDLL